MASPSATDRGDTAAAMTSLAESSLFEESQISATVTADDAPKFFKQHGIFYKADAEIGRQARLLGHNSDMRKEMLMSDPRFARILEHFIASPYVPIFLGKDQGNFYAFTNKDNQDHRIIVYIWPGATTFDFFDESHKGLNKGVVGSNGYVHIPYSWLRERKLKEVRGVMKDGGLMIVHLRLALHVENASIAYGFVYQRTDAGD